MVSVLVAEMPWEPLRSGVVVGTVASSFGLYCSGRVRCHGRREVIWAIAALGCPHECWECLALVASELHAMCWKDPCWVGSRIAGDFVEDELRKMLVDGDLEELQSFWGLFAGR